MKKRLQIVETELQIVDRLFLESWPFLGIYSPRSLGVWNLLKFSKN